LCAVYKTLKISGVVNIPFKESGTSLSLSSEKCDFL